MKSLSRAVINIAAFSANPKRVSPKIEFINVTDRALKEYWPDGVTRFRMEFINPGLKGEQSVVFTPANKNESHEVSRF